MYSRLFIVLGFVIFGGYCGPKIPSYIHICKRDDPEVAKCIKESIEIIRPRLVKGIKEIGVPAMEPLRLHNLDVGRGSPLFTAVLSDIDVYGASDFQLNKLKVNIPSLTFRILLNLPILRLIGHFDINARILSLPFRGEGKFYANATQCIANAVLKANLTKINGEDHMHFTNLDIKLQIGDYHIKLESGPKSEPTIILAANEVLNSNKKDIIDVITPFIETRVSEIILEIANDIVTYFSYDDVFPEK